MEIKIERESAMIYTAHSTNMDSEKNLDPNIQPRMVTLLKENIREDTCNLIVGGFCRKNVQAHTKIQITEPKMDKSYFFRT